MVDKFLSTSERMTSSSLILAFGSQEVLSPISYMSQFLPPQYALEQHLDSEVGELPVILDSSPHNIVLVISSVDYPVKPERDILLHLKKRQYQYSHLPVIRISNSSNYIEMLMHTPLSRTNPGLYWFVNTPNFDHIGLSELVLKALSEHPL